MRDWLELAQERLAAGQACALITVTQTFGSTPREPGARMLIARDFEAGTIGGGKLELDASARARALLASNESALVETYSLGARLGQCCGGKVELLIQRFDPDALGLVSDLRELRACAERHACVIALNGTGMQRAIVTLRGARADVDGHVLEAAQRVLREDPRCSAPRWLDVLAHPRVLFDPPPERGLPIVLFGAGHVGRALVHVLAPLGWPITWVETRDDALPAGMPQDVTAIATDTPEACVDEAAPGSALVIMTHDHALDYRLCERALTRADLAFCGLIGSRTKRAKFLQRMAARGASAQVLARITCPIGVPPRAGKKPFEVAISAAAQLLQVHEAQRALHADTHEPRLARGALHEGLR